MHAVLYSHVYLWKAGEDVDGEEELYGEVLRHTFVEGLMTATPEIEETSCHDYTSSNAYVRGCPHVTQTVVR